MNAALDVPPPPTDAPKASRPKALALVGGLYLVIFAVAAIIDVGKDWGVVNYSEFVALPLTFIGMLMALCSLGAIWWATSRWPSYAKTLPVMGAGLMCWLGLSLVTGLSDTARSGSWAIAFELQVVLTAALAAAADYRFRPGGQNRQQQFTILWLLIWTGVLGIVLGAGRALTAMFGWTLEVFAWQFFWHVQIFAIANGLLAGTLFAAVIADGRWWSRAAVCAVATAGVAGIVPLAFALLFNSIGSRVADIVIMFTTHALFLLAALVPVRRSCHQPQQRPGVESPDIKTSPPPGGSSGRGFPWGAES